MSDQTEIERLREQFTDVSNRLIKVEVTVAAICASFAKHEERENDRNQRVPTLLLGAIAGATGVVSVLVQLWFTRGP